MAGDGHAKEDMGPDSRPAPAPESPGASKPHRPPGYASKPHRPPGYAYEHFDRAAQLRRMLLFSLARWLMTVALACSIYALLWSFSSKTALTNDKKREFNGLIIGLSIGLGLNTASSIKAITAEVRWWLLSLGPWSPRESDLILQSENLSRLILLGCTSRRLIVRLFVAFFLLVNIASQVALAALGLTYNLNPADKVTVTKPGLVSVPDLSSIQTAKVLSSSNPSQAISALRYTANSYGLVALTYGFGVLSEVPQPGAIFNPDNNLTYCGGHNSCRYVFFEATTVNSSYYSMVATSRYVSTSASCQSWRIVRGGNGMQRSIVVGDANNTEFGPLPALNGPDQTLFMYDPEQPSGDTWSVVSAMEASSKEPWFYRCNVSVGPVQNAVVKEHLLGANLSRMAVSAIALQGYGASTTTGSSNSTARLQFQSYPAEAWFGSPQRGDVGGMGLMMAQFSAGVIAVTAQSNSNIVVPGLVPLKGVTVEIPHWSYVHLVLGLTVGLQLLFAVVALATTSRVQVRGHSHLAMASLLRPVLHGVSSRASAANGRQIASMLGASAQLSYVPSGRAGGYHVETDH
ncbi:uncharacterized protein HRG_09398 [Hirsutella rhossiliensis]|uniref:Uncharacterized protein n=1 Tax=Hirsutella rhossiliensis TaxID=111463 RepID=A0A9P8SG29_9HYPO|nr:uncharacterized protein HRG_09398 [Hirsutella rhossiliensis]KAH0959616.1 hypothetical protein HRG_09398 [Hirsutella rhossiliensis]